MVSGSCSCTRVPVLIVSSVIVIKDNGMDSKSLWLSFVNAFFFGFCLRPNLDTLGR